MPRPEGDRLFPKYFAPYKRSFLTKPATEFRDLWENRKDILLNVLLFMPLGFLLAGYLNSRGFASPYAILLTIAMGFSLSLAIESIQAFLPSRQLDLMDLITNTMGTIVGSILSQAQGSRNKVQGTRKRTAQGTRYTAQGNGKQATGSWKQQTANRKQNLLD